MPSKNDRALDSRSLIDCGSIDFAVAVQASETRGRKDL